MYILFNVSCNHPWRSLRQNASEKINKKLQHQLVSLCCSLVSVKKRYRKYKSCIFSERGRRVSFTKPDQGRGRGRGRGENLHSSIPTTLFFLFLTVDRPHSTNFFLSPSLLLPLKSKMAAIILNLNPFHCLTHGLVITSRSLDRNVFKMAVD